MLSGIGLLALGWYAGATVTRVHDSGGGHRARRASAAQPVAATQADARPDDEDDDDFDQPTPHTM